jgi:hypothetical protein
MYGKTLGTALQIGLFRLDNLEVNFASGGQVHPLGQVYKMVAHLSERVSLFLNPEKCSLAFPLSPRTFFSPNNIFCRFQIKALSTIYGQLLRRGESI